MAAPARFLFDMDFSEPVLAAEPPPPPEPMISLAGHQALLAAAEQAAYDTGVAEGRRSAEARAADRLADEAGRLAGAAQAILGVLDDERRRIEAEAMRLAEAVAFKLAGTLIERQPRELVLAVLTDALAPLRKAPHLVIRLANADAEPIRAAVTSLAAQRGFEGRLVVLGEDGMARGDCRIEWADGGIVFERASVEATIRQAIDNHLLPDGEGAAGQTPNGVTT
jgi:flagellar assembly protein FliH